MNTIGFGRAKAFVETVRTAMAGAAPDIERHCVESMPSYGERPNHEFAAFRECWGTAAFVREVGTMRDAQQRASRPVSGSAGAR